MKKILLVLALLVSLGACADENDPTLVIQKASSEITNHRELVSATDYKLRVKVLDDLSAEKSVYSESSEGSVTDFYSKRSVRIVDDFGSDFLEDTNGTAIIYNSEALVDRQIFRYASMRPLEKNKEYIVYLSYSDAIEGYIIPLFESAIVSFNQEDNATDHEAAKMSDFITILSLDESVSEKDLKSLENAEYQASIREYIDVIHLNLAIENFKYDIYVSDLAQAGSVVEIDNSQYEVPDKLNLRDRS